MALLQFLSSNRDVVLGQTLQQIVSNAGDGILRDGAVASAEFREFLALVPIECLFSYVRQCLDTPFAKSGYVLQDLVNELGRRLDFDVRNGLYQGKRNAIGFDGIWTATGEPELVVEVKSTDTYSFQLDTMDRYRQSLTSDSSVSREASVLIVVGREDTGALEAQIRGSRFAWDMRLISAESLIKLVQIRAKSDDLATVRQIHQVLRPLEYTKVDRIIDLLFVATTDVETQQEEAQLESAPQEGAAPAVIQVQDKTERGLIEEKKIRAVKGFADSKAVTLVQRNRSCFWSGDKKVRVCCTVSKRYEGDYQPYWYAYHPKWDDFLGEGDGYLILACMDLNSAFAIPHSWLSENAKNLNRTERESGKLYWHIPITTLDDGTLAINMSKVGRKYPLKPHQFAIAAAAT